MTYNEMETLYDEYGYYKDLEPMVSKMGEMKVLEMVEHEDGSATLTFDFDADTAQFLINYAITDIINKQIAVEKVLSEPFEYDNAGGEQP